VEQRISFVEFQLDRFWLGYGWRYGQLLAAPPSRRFSLAGTFSGISAPDAFDPFLPGPADC
jgi:hypothetical protein